MRKKYLKDLNAPKKPTRPFIFFLISVRKSVQKELGFATGNGEVSKECGRRWASMTPGEKEKYNKMFREDNKRYQEASKDYKPSPEIVENARLSKLHKRLAKPRKTSAMVSNSNALAHDPLILPECLNANTTLIKKPTSPFVYFLMDVTESVKKELGFNRRWGFNIQSLVSKECGEKWASMTPGEKQKYLEMSREDTKRYQLAVKNYKPCPGFVEKVSYFQFLASSWANVADSIPRLKPCQVQEEVWRRWCKREQSESSGQRHAGDENLDVKKFKRRISKKVNNNYTNVDAPEAPKLAFHFFQSTMKEELEKCLPDMPFTHMVKHVKAKWKVMTDEQKVPFFNLERKYEGQIKEKMNYDLATSCEFVKEGDYNGQGMEQTGAKGVEFNLDELNTIISVNCIKSKFSTKWTCAFCGQITATKLDVSRHIEAKHVPLPNLKCDVCQNPAKTRDSLRRHMTKHHKVKC